jgi:hypothetical protein
MELRTGFDYHLAETKVAHGGYRAECNACGWYGDIRGTRADADDDATAHDIASNPPSNG